MIICVVLVIWIGSVSSTDCPDRWVAFEGSCYLFEHDTADFTEAEHFCEERNSHLVAINSREENSFLKDYMADYNSHYWLGMTDKTVEGFWRWFVDDSRVEFYDWGPGEPQDAGSGEDCAVFAPGYTFKWADVACSRSFRPICELSTTAEIIG